MEQSEALGRLSPRGRLAGYALAIFLSSAGVMALEIAAARLLAPYIGVSLYSWTAIIGVVLGGLSIGNWIGGVWADRGAKESAAGWVLGASALACIGVLLMLTVVAPPLQRIEMSLLTASFLFVAALFFVPALLLGVVTPLLTTLALRLDARTGHVVGTLHALGAFGSIVGTFVTGYFLIQYFGTQAVILGTGAILGTLALAFLWRSWKSLAALVVAALLLGGWTSARAGFQPMCERETSYFCIRVIDMSREMPFGNARGLVLDHLMHGINHEQLPRFLPSPYIHLMDEMIGLQANTVQGRELRSFFAGGGAYTQPRALRARFPDAEIVIAELDPEVTQMARAHMYYNGEGDRVIHSDARRALAQMPEGHFDVIVGDVYHDISIPYHLVTREYAALVQSRLAPGGLYVLNVIDAHPDPKLVKSIVKTYATVFGDVRVWLEYWPQRPERMTYVISMGGAAMLPPTLYATEGPRREWIDVTGVLLSSGTPLDELPVLTDNLAPVERLLTSLIFGELGR